MQGSHGDESMSHSDQMWVVSLEKRTVRHRSGFFIQFEGTPEYSDFGGFPRNADQLPPVHCAALIREGFCLYQRIYFRNIAENTVKSHTVPVITRKPRRRVMMKHEET